VVALVTVAARTPMYAIVATAMQLPPADTRIAWQAPAPSRRAGVAVRATSGGSGQDVATRGAADDVAGAAERA
jgi:hypothetical protein